MIKSENLTVETTPISLLYRESIDSIRGQTICVQNTDATNAVYLGGTEVTVDNGYVLPAGAQIAVTLETVQDFYAVSGGSVVVSVLWIDVN